MYGLSSPNKLHYEGVHCTLFIEQFSNGVVLLRISGTDVGEFGQSPMTALKIGSRARIRSTCSSTLVTCAEHPLRSAPNGLDG